MPSPRLPLKSVPLLFLIGCSAFATESALPDATVFNAMNFGVSPSGGPYTVTESSAGTPSISSVRPGGLGYGWGSSGLGGYLAQISGPDVIGLLSLGDGNSSLAGPDDPQAYASLGLSGVTGSSLADYTYYFEITGPAPTVDVQVGATGFLSLTTAGLSNWDARSLFTVSNSETDAGVLSDSVSYSDLGYVNPIGQTAGTGVLTDTGGDGTYAGTFADTGIYTLSTGVTYEVQLSASVGTGDTAAITASAGVDPMFSIAPDVTDSGDYNILYSEAYQPPFGAVPDMTPTFALFACAATLLLAFSRKCRPASD